MHRTIPFEIGRRQAIRLLAGTALLGGAGLLPRPSLAQAARKFEYVTPAGIMISFSEALVPKAAGLFAKQGLDVTVEGGKSAIQGPQQILSGQAQAARTGGINLMRAVANEEAPLIAIATIAQISPFALVSAAAKPIRSGADMVGKTIGVVARKGSTETTLDLYLIKSKIPLDQVKREPVGDTPAAWGLIEAGRIDGFVTSVGTLVRLQAQKLPILSFRIEDGIPGQVIVAGRDLVAKEPGLFVSFLRGVRQGVERVIDDKDGDATLKLLSTFDIAALKEPAVAHDDLKANIELWLARGRDNLLRNIPADWESAAGLLVEAGLMKRADVKTMYTNDLLDQAKI